MLQPEQNARDQGAKKEGWVLGEIGQVVGFLLAFVVMIIFVGAALLALDIPAFLRMIEEDERNKQPKEN